MKNADKPAHPLNGKNWQDNIGRGVSSTDYAGLSKREYFAAMAMQGFCACPDLHISRESLAFESVKQADELLKQLES